MLYEVITVFNHTAPMGIDHHRAFFTGSDTIFPVILIRKTTPRPTKHGQIHSFQGFYNVRADAVYIGNRAVIPNPKAFINAAPEMSYNFV